jgi:aspartate aminotransferase
MEIKIEKHVDAIRMPENLKVGLMVAEHRKKCEGTDCKFDYFALGFGQSPFHVPPGLARALGENAEQGHYSAAEGIKELREAVSGFNKRHFTLNLDPERIIIGPGTKELLHMIFNIIQGGVIIPSPSWIGYYPEITLLDKHFHTLHLRNEDNYKINPALLDEFIQNLHKEKYLLVLNNPHNPTGNVYSKEELGAIAEVCRRHEVIVVADEIYALTTYDIKKFTSMASVYPEGTFVTNGLSKDRSAGGYRLGHLILPYAAELRDAFKKVAATIITNVSTPTQLAAITAYSPNEEIEDYFEITRNIHRMVGNFMAKGLNSIEGLQSTIPEGGFYCFVSFNELKDELNKKGVNDSNALADSLLSHPHHIATVTGDAVMLEPDDFGARLAFVDYDGKKAFENYKKNPPEDEEAFVKENMPRIHKSIEAFRKYVEWLKVCLK